MRLWAVQINPGSSLFGTSDSDGGSHHWTWLIPARKLSARHLTPSWLLGHSNDKISARAEG